MYVSNDGVIDEAATNYIAVGTLVEYVSATSGWVDIGKRAKASGDDEPMQVEYVSAVPAGKNARKIVAYSVLGAGDGIAMYMESHITGAMVGVGRGAGCWVNLDSGMTLNGSLLGFDIGIYGDSDVEGSGNIAALNIDLQMPATLTPGIAAFIRTNSNQAGHDPDYLFWFNNDEAACLVKSDPGTSFYGYLKAFSGTGNVALAIPVVNVT